jgi:hypothetical protein
MEFNIALVHPYQGASRKPLTLAMGDEYEALKIYLEKDKIVV